jgi:hypothetical protein
MLVSSLLFFTPEGYLLDMEKLWMNEFITPTIWESFMTNQLKQWGDGILLVMAAWLDQISSDSRDCYPGNCDAYS